MVSHESLQQGDPGLPLLQQPLLKKDRAFKPYTAYTLPKRRAHKLHRRKPKGPKHMNPANRRALNPMWRSKALLLTR